MRNTEELLTYLHTFSTGVVIIRLLLATLCGGLIGFCRSVKKRGAGFKTHLLVCLGSALIMLTGEYIYCYISHGTGDVARMAAQVVSGVGFLGAGTIMVTGGSHQVRGLTTAAGLWTCAGIGLALGIGFYSGGIVCTIITFFVYVYMQRIDEFAYEHSRVYEFYAEFQTRTDVMEFISEMKVHGYKFIDFEIGRPRKNKSEIVSVNMTIEVGPKAKNKDVLEFIEGMEGLLSIAEV